MCDTTVIKQAVFQGFYTDLSLWSVMVGNPYRYRAALQQLENRHATAGKRETLLRSACHTVLVPYFDNDSEKGNYKN
jgi:hypothetical protein